MREIFKLYKSICHLKKVYKNLAKQYHPDRFPAGSTEQNEAKNRFSAINKAYDILGTESKRQNYLDTRRLLAEHLAIEIDTQSPVEAANPQAASAPTPAAPNNITAPPTKKKDPPREDYKLKEAEDAFKDGTTLLSKNKLDEAISAFQQAISILPDTAKYHSSLGKAYTLKGWKGMAQSALKQALVLNPNDATAKKLYEPEKPKKKGMLDGLFGKFKK